MWCDAPVAVRWRMEQAESRVGCRKGDWVRTSSIASIAKPMTCGDLARVHHLGTRWIAPWASRYVQEATSPTGDRRDDRSSVGWCRDRSCRSVPAKGEKSTALVMVMGEGGKRRPFGKPKRGGGVVAAGWCLRIFAHLESSKIWLDRRSRRRYGYRHANTSTCTYSERIGWAGLGNRKGSDV
ncbi:hypothetical protein K431DRAFT_68534 [Polychaeton citri CBS 116435]|uniref:Uncharacterized protein n=1 Tax=Polychaeton citri CBS 116435 TaxID=1314669 RepID=A0A9P4Q850_9PEZI|nr:hypothetical protein K431DRAFT_68534 [Polychaeton citri CBS 116435]